MFLSVILLFIIFATCVYYLLFQREHNLPPGPRGYPIIGNILDLVLRDPRVVFAEYRLKYGDLFTIRAFNKVFIICNGYDTLIDVFVKQSETFSERPVNAVIMATKHGHGFWGPPGSRLWKKNRRFCKSTLKDIIMGRNIMQTRIHEEIKFLLESIERHNGEPFNINSLLYRSVANVIIAIVIGKRFSYDDPVYCEMIRNQQELGNTNFAFARPFFRMIPGDPFQIARFYKNRKFLGKFFEKLVDEHSENYTEGPHDNLVDAYIGKMRQPPRGEENDMNKNELVTIIETLLAAGTGNATNALLFGTAYLLHNQAIQDKLGSELDRTISSDRLPGINDKMKLPFMEATILEILRYAGLAPFSVPHASNNESTVNGYRIPKGTTLLPNLQSVLMDKKLWNDPECFHPARFLNADGTVERMKEFIPFSLGERSCIGESIAMAELFLFFSAMLQRFEFRPATEGDLPRLDSKFAFAVAPYSFMVRALPRKRGQ